MQLNVHPIGIFLPKFTVSKKKKSNSYFFHMNDIEWKLQTYGFFVGHKTAIEEAVVSVITSQ